MEHGPENHRGKIRLCYVRAIQTESCIVFSDEGTFPIDIWAWKRYGGSLLVTKTMILFRCLKYFVN